MLTLGIMGSGSGTNMQSIIDAIAQNRLDAHAGCVISDVKDAFILERARQYGIPAIYVDCTPYRTKLEGPGEDRVIEIMRKHSVDTIVLAGFMRIIKPGLLDAFPGRILNIHPALLPAFPGLHSWKQALDYGVKVAGCTVHFVDAGMDTGPIIVQRTVQVEEDDTPETLHARIQAQEHEAYTEALQLLAEGQLHVEGRRVFRS
jgi:phosphoribosylglycinamide formyltransferase-1